jgi:hypothetical protein
LPHFDYEHEHRFTEHEHDVLLHARTSVVTDVAGDHVSKSQESTGGDFGAPHCSLLTDSIKWLFEQPSGFEHEVLDRFRVA